MHGVGIGGGVHGDGPDPHLPAGPVDPQRNFTTIGNQDLFEHPGRLLNDQKDFVKLNRLAIFNQDLTDRSGLRGDERIHHFHGFDDQ